MLLKYPSHRNTLATRSGGLQTWHTACSSATKKKGSQQATNAPVMIARVFAAFLSRFDSIVSRVRFVETTCCCWLVLVGFVSVVVVVVVDTAVGVTVADGVTFAPLYDDDFSGDIDEWSGVDLVIVNAVDSSRGLRQINQNHAGQKTTNEGMTGSL